MPPEDVAAMLHAITLEDRKAELRLGLAASAVINSRPRTTKAARPEVTPAKLFPTLDRMVRLARGESDGDDSGGVFAAVARAMQALGGRRRADS